MSTAVDSFPTIGILPKNETQAAQFIQNNPEFDGRGVVCAILDTGVDPGAIGLQVTSDGKQKVIDVIDCSGGGDVDMTTVVKSSSGTVTEDGHLEIKGLTGRTLRIPADWVATNPSGDWRIGMKRSYELYSKTLYTRVCAERKKEWEKGQRGAESTLQKEIQQWNVAHTSPTQQEKTELQDLNDRLSQLQEAAKNYDDPGPVYDCIMWNTNAPTDNKKDSTDSTDIDMDIHEDKDKSDEKGSWLVVVDTTETGDLVKAATSTTNPLVPLKEYRFEYQYGTFTSVDCLNYAVNVYDNGDVLSIVSDASPHGTHVAGIVGAYHPDNPECNGLAPGVQIVSLKIGDTRLKTMETMPALLRGLIHAIKLKVDIINLSYGEACAVPDKGRFVALAEELVYKHGIMFCASAGNNGPALGTLSCPGGTTTCVMGIGAYVSPTMMQASYSMRKVPDEGCNYTWSSPGPAYDGEWGVSVMAPGGAIAPVSNWTLQKNQLMHGTSMSSPNCTGNICLLLSACKAEGIPHGPIRVRRAVENTAKHLPNLEKLVQGHGLVQVASAWEHLHTHSKSFPDYDVRYNVTVNSANGSDNRGVVLRHIHETYASVPTSHTVTISPVFPEELDNTEKIKYEQMLKLKCDAAWVSIPTSLVLMNNGRTFSIAVDTTCLPPGLHFTTIHGIDTTNPLCGHVFTIPVTVMKPLQQSNAGSVLDLGNTLFRAGAEIERRFIVPPEGTQWMDVIIKDLRPETPNTSISNTGGSLSDDTFTYPQGGGHGQKSDPVGRVIVLHTVQNVPHTPYRDLEKDVYLQLKPGQIEVYSIRVEGTSPIEVTLSQYWNTFGVTPVSCTINFCGVCPSNEQVLLHTGCGHTKILLDSKLRPEEISISSKLSTWQQKLSSTTQLIVPLGERDIAPDSRQIYSLVMEYSFNQSEPADVTPEIPTLNNYLYEGVVDGQMVMIYDANKRLIGTSDAYPTSIKCGKGDHVARVEIRSEDVTLLKKLQVLPLTISQPLKAKDVQLQAYSNIHSCVAGGRTYPSTTLRPGQKSMLFIAEPNSTKLPSGIKPGHLLTGTINYVKGKNNMLGEGKRPAGYTVTYAMGPNAPKIDDKDKDKGKPPAKEESEEVKISNSVRDLRVTSLQNLSATDTSTFQSLYEKALADYPDHLPLLQAELVWLDNEKARDTRLADIVRAADDVIKQIDTGALAAHFGTNLPEDNAEATQLRTEMTKKRDALRDALARKARALIGPKESSEKESSKKDLEELSALEVEVEVGSLKLGEEESKESSGKDLPGAEESSAKDPAISTSAFDDVYKELQKWDDLSADKYGRISLHYFMSHERFGSALKLLNKQLEVPPGTKATPGGISSQDARKERRNVYRRLGWDHLIPHENTWSIVSYPSKYAPF